jgi:hypothetical protein
VVKAEKSGRCLIRINRCGRRWWAPAFVLSCLLPGGGIRAQFVIADIIKAAVKKVIVAADLQVQRMQTETIGLQNAEKELENNMALEKLNDISGWVQQQRDLFAGYYQELWEVKNALATYEEVRAMIEKQGQIVAAYRQVYTVLKQDKHFSVEEVNHMNAVLSGIMNQSVQNLDHLSLVVNALLTQMGDAPRLKIIDEAGSGIDRNYTDLAQFSQQCLLLSLQRSKDAGEVAVTKALYGIE